MEEAHQVATTASPKLNITTTTATSSVKLNSHMVGKERESISNEVLQEAASSRGAGRRGARNRAAVRSGGRGLMGSRMRSRWVADLVLSIEVKICAAKILKNQYSKAKRTQDILILLA